MAALILIRVSLPSILSVLTVVFVKTDMSFSQLSVQTRLVFKGQTVVFNPVFIALFLAVSNKRCNSLTSLSTRIIAKKLFKFGKAIVAIIPAIAIVTISSTIVKPFANLVTVFATAERLLILFILIT